jgi:spermidine synthase
VRQLWQNGGSSSAENVATGFPTHPYTTTFRRLLEPVIERVDSVLVLGGAALSLPVALATVHPHLTVDVVELDPVVTRLAREYFAYGSREWPQIRVAHGDARLFLRRSEARYDVILVVVFDNLITVPWTMVTVEALTAMRERLAPAGFVVINMLTPLEGSGVEFLERLLATADQVFSAVRAYPVTMAVAPGATRNVLLVLAASPDALPPLDWPTVGRGPAGRPLTDAHAPVEYLQAKVFWEGLSWY